VTYIFFVLKVIWIPLEINRLRFGYRGNINETFPELIAFLIFTIFFVFPLDVMPIFQLDLFPHERIICIINIAFVVFEIIFSIIVMRTFMKTQSAAFYLRTAPLIDKLFRKRFAGQNDIMSVREIQLGMQHYNRVHDNVMPFPDSDLMLRDLGDGKLMAERGDM